MRRFDAFCFLEVFLPAVPKDLEGDRGLLIKRTVCVLVRVSPSGAAGLKLSNMERLFTPEFVSVGHPLKVFRKQVMTHEGAPPQI